MDTNKNTALKTGRNMGAVLGGIAFLIVGLIPAFYLGSMGTVALLAKILGPLEPGIVVRLLIVVGTTLTILLGAVLAIAAGGALGWALTLLIEALSAEFARPKIAKKSALGK